jgi:dTDP-4-amino-4,6-dideoxygalactose transaminase
VVRVENRGELIKHLASSGIGTGIHYPIPLHLQSAYTALGYKRGDFPIAEMVAAQVLSLPMYPQLQEEQQRRVVRELTRFTSTEVPSLMESKIA